MSEDLKLLIQKKDDLEKQIVTLKAQINSVEVSEGYNKKLVDEEGFPRPDLDFGKLTDYRLLKKQCNELQTDHKALMAKIESQLIEYHQELAKSGQVQKEIEQYEADLEKKKEIERKQLEIQRMNEELKKQAEKKEEQKKMPVPFCFINTVIDNSPAHKGGVRLNDLVCTFGDLTYEKFTELNQLAAIVRFNIEKEIFIEVLRTADMNSDSKDILTYKGENYVLEKCIVVPRKWEGEGVLG